MSNLVLLNISIETSAQEIWKILHDVETFNQCFRDLKTIISGIIEVGEKVLIASKQRGEKTVNEINIKSVETDKCMSFGLKKTK